MNWQDFELTTAGIVILLLILLLFLWISYLLGSCKHVFEREGRQINLTLIRYLLGIIPTKRQQYEGIVSGEIREFVTTFDDSDYDCAEYTLITQQNEKILLNRLVSKTSPKKVKALAEQIDAFLRSPSQTQLVLHTRRVRSFINSIFANAFIGVFLVPTLFFLVAFTDFMPELVRLNHSPTSVAELIKDKKSLSFGAESASDFPSDIPVPRLAEVKLANFEDATQKWKLMLSVASSNDQGKALAENLRTWFKEKGWQTTQLSELPLYVDGSETPEALGSAYTFDFRRQEGQKTGNVLLMKEGSSEWSLSYEY